MSTFDPLSSDAREKLACLAPVVASLAASAPARADNPPPASERTSSVVISSTGIKDPRVGDPSLQELTSRQGNNFYLRGFTTRGALQASSRLGQDTAAQYEVAPRYVVLSAMAKYAVSHSSSLQINIGNLTRVSVT